MPLYKLTKGSIGLIVNGESVDIKKGDTVELSKERAKDFKYLKKVGDIAVELTGKLAAVDWSKTQDMKAPEVVALVNETDSKDELQALYETESEGQNRIGVMNAIKKRITQLETD